MKTFDAKETENFNQDLDQPPSCSFGISFANLKFSSIRGKRQQQRDEDSSVSDDDISSPEHKISKKDRVFLITMMKVNEAMDKTTKKNPTRNQDLVDWRITAKISF
ncbi:MAG: hypothetical protein ACK53Y_03990 [bacterium]